LSVSVSSSDVMKELLFLILLLLRKNIEQLMSGNTIPQLHADVSLVSVNLFSLIQPQLYQQISENNHLLRSLFW